MASLLSSSSSWAKLGWDQHYRSGVFHQLNCLTKAQTGQKRMGVHSIDLQVELWHQLIDISPKLKKKKKKNRYTG